MELLLNEAIYRRVIVELLPQTRKFLWIVTADIKDLHVALTTAQLVSIAEDAGIEFPGHPLGREEPHQRAGKILGKLFRETEGQAVVVDGITVTRDEREVHVAGRGYETQKLYTFTQNATI